MEEKMKSTGAKKESNNVPGLCLSKQEIQRLVMPYQNRNALDILEKEHKALKLQLHSLQDKIPSDKFLQIEQAISNIVETIKNYRKNIETADRKLMELESLIIQDPEKAVSIPLLAEKVSSLNKVVNAALLISLTSIAIVAGIVIYLLSQ